MFQSEDHKPPIEIPIDAISKEALEGIIDSFILREGTDYGLVEAQHQTKYQQIQRQILKGDVKIVFDHITESVTLMTKNEWSKRSCR